MDNNNNSRVKIRHIFNKNHIEILRVEFPQNDKLYEFPKYSFFKTSASSNVTVVDETKLYPRSQIKTNKSGCKYIVEQRKSPLGFYYNVQHILNSNKKVDDTYRVRKILNLYVDEGVVYQLRYMIAYDQNRIGSMESDLRPWDIVPGDKSFSDNMLNALVEDVTNLFNLAEGRGIQKLYTGIWSYYSKDKDFVSLHNVRCEVFKDLFGNVNGPRVQTNEEKILAHGFDLKYSFRKDKENGK